ncbi:unnamed protein product [Euphydryas editha]|uniref:Uncharacterized protein n=1 Tax=Euphydryas editha TaxID=104508 RepID=A0AAU9V7T9_EUPED|nr:unnamed protein product [Euphydryas editha]
MLRVIAYLLACLSAAMARDVGKVLRTMPIVTNSLVNMGKLDIAFYFNTRPHEFAVRSELPSHGFNNPSVVPKLEPIITEPCPCSSLKYIKDSRQNNPSELINKILSGNDLFSFREPTSSTLCCDSHENVKEDILFEFGPKQSQIVANQQNNMPFLPLLLETIQNKPNLMPSKTKAVEIFILPKKQEYPMVFDKFINNNKKNVKNDNIKIVGDKEIKNDFKSNRFVPPFVSSVKKDLTLQEKVEHVTKTDTKPTVNLNSNIV